MAPKTSNTPITKAEAKKALIEARRERVQADIETHTERAVEVLHEVMDSEDTPAIVRVTAAKDLLDRGGFKPVDKAIVAHTFPKPIIDIEQIRSGA